MQARTMSVCTSTSHPVGALSIPAVCIFSPNDIDYPLAIWAVHRLGAIVTWVLLSLLQHVLTALPVRPANPSYTAEELVHQLSTAKAGLIIVNPESLSTAVAAARAIGLSEDRIVLMSRALKKGVHETVETLALLGAKSPPDFDERVLTPNEAKTKLAFMSFSSGTTGGSSAQNHRFSLTLLKGRPRSDTPLV